MKKALLISFLLSATNFFSQTPFGSETRLVDDLDYVTDNTPQISSDLNNDGYKELIVVGNNNLFWYKNVEGDLQYEQTHLISTDTYELTSIKAVDLNNDGLNDIAGVNRYNNKLVYYINLGNDNFSDEIVIDSSLNSPRLIDAEDFNNDGYFDIIISTENNDSLKYYENNGDSTFNSPIDINTISNIIKIKIVDFDNDGNPDVLTNSEDSSLYINKGNPDGTFQSSLLLNYVIGDFDVIDINNDDFLDIVASYDNNIIYYQNISGNTLTLNWPLNNTIITPQKIATVDFDNDGVQDILVTTSDGFALFKKENGFFNYFPIETPLLNSIKNSLIDDFNNDNYPDIICLSNVNQNQIKKLSHFKHNPDTSIFEETVLSTLLTSITSTKIGDLDNDGLNDIVLSSSSNIIWNKNLGDGKFSSYRFINSDLFPGSTTDLELADINNDDWIDVIVSENEMIAIYVNQGNETFNKITIPAFHAKDIEIADIDNDNNLDIVICNPNYAYQPGLGIIKNLGNLTFTDIDIVDFNSDDFKPTKIAGGDVDSDGDIDLIISSKETAMIFYLNNDGDGDFTLNVVNSSINTEPIELADVDNDDYLDIISADFGNDDSPYNLFWIKNDDGNFSSSVNIISENQQLNSIIVRDLDDDGINEIITTTYQYFTNSELDDKIIVYTFNGTSYEENIVDLNYSGQMSIDIGNLNNSGILDLTLGYYDYGVASYFMSESDLEISRFDETFNNFKIYPNPVLSNISWNSDSIYDITIYDINGKKIKDFNSIKNSLNVDFLDKGLYFMKFKFGSKTLTKKIIKK